mmetsp:Transcript_21587/g.32052  ORF Transcript_21587/g.32052 Transcript_21587/m.32052 type:complete len:326 (+) Transcript_21587:118-1095(+)
MRFVHYFGIVWSGIIVALSIASLGLSAALFDEGYDGDQKAAYGSHDVHVAFGVVGSVLSMFASALGILIYLSAPEQHASVLTKCYIGLALISTFFLAGDAGGWTEIVRHDVENVGLMRASLGIEIAIGFLWFLLLLVVFWTGVLGDNQSSTVDTNKSGEYTSLTNNQASTSSSAATASTTHASIGYPELFSGAMVVFFLITLSLAAANKNGDAGEEDDSGWYYVVRTSDTMAGLALSGASLGILTALGGLLMPMLQVPAFYIRVAWLASAMFAFWLICAAFGTWALSWAILKHQDLGFDLFAAEMAFELITSVAWGALIVFYPRW